MIIMISLLRRRLNILGIGKKQRKYRKKNPSLYYNARTYSQPREINFKLYINILKILIPTTVLVYVTFFSNIFSIKEVIVSGNSSIPSEEITKYSPLGNNILFEKTIQMEDNILKNIPEINNVKIYKGIPNALKIIVEENSPVMIWVSESKKYLINDSGYAYKGISDSDTIPENLPVVYDNKNVKFTIPCRITTQKYVTFVNFINDNIKNETNIDPDTFFVEETTVDLNLKTKNGYFIKFDTLRSPEQQIKNLKLVLIDKKNDIKEYVDLRVNGWAYYK